MSTSNGILQAGTLVSNKLAATTLLLDDSSAPSLNVNHLWQAGVINLSAGLNPQQGFSVTPVAQGNTQTFQGPNIVAANSLQAPGTVSLGAANVTTSLQVTGPSTLTGNVKVTGSFQTTGSTSIGNVLQVGNTTVTPILQANVITATGPTANAYIETTSAVAGNTAGLYLGGGWDIKVLAGGQLAFQSLLNGQRVNSFVINPSGISVTAGQAIGSVN